MSEQSFAVTVVIKPKQGSNKPHDMREAVKVVRALLDHTNAVEVVEVREAGEVKS